MDFENYLRKVVNIAADPNTLPSLRLGQIHFNELYEVRPDLADQVRGRHTDLDPFYYDKNIQNFLKFVQENW